MLTQLNYVSSCHNYIDGLVQERRNSIAYTLELRLFGTNLWIWYITMMWTGHSHVFHYTYMVLTCLYHEIRNYSKRTFHKISLFRSLPICEIGPALLALSQEVFTFVRWTSNLSGHCNLSPYSVDNRLSNSINCNEKDWFNFLCVK